METKVHSFSSPESRNIFALARGVRVARTAADTMKDTRGEMAVKQVAILTIIALLTAYEKFIQGNEIVESTSEGQHQHIQTTGKTQQNLLRDEGEKNNCVIWSYVSRRNVK